MGSTALPGVKAVIGGKVCEEKAFKQNPILYFREHVITCLPQSEKTQALKETHLLKDNLLEGSQSMLFQSARQNADLPDSGSAVPGFLSQQEENGDDSL